MPVSGTEIIRLISGLADPARRGKAASMLARRLGAETLLVLIRDPDLGVLRPAPGFPQTLPGGPMWRRFLARCSTPGEYEDEIPFPDQETLRSVRTCVADEGSALLLVGGQPSLTLAELDELGFPLLFALLRAESAQIAAAGFADAARNATQHATALAVALDAARGEIEQNANRLERTLAEAARLNRDLRDLNETLELRVAERTRALEQEIAERRKAEAALMQAQRLEAIGQLTGGVAHDFNNLLTVVLGQADSIIRAAKGDERITNMAISARRAAERGAQLTGQLLAFARRQSLKPSVATVDRLIASFADLVRQAVGEAITVEFTAEGGLWSSLIDAAQFEAAILNLTINARDAMPQGGRLTIASRNRTVAGREALRLDLPPGDYVVVSMTDTGSGMTSEVLERCFEPFFTTKDVGKGTGLGLSQIYGFARQSGGAIAIDSAVGRGTTASLYLPRAPAEERDEPAATAEPKTRGEGRTILVVEDQPEVREIIEISLSNLGYRVLTAADGREARKLVESTENFDLLLTDVIMPNGVNGIALAQFACRLRPDLRVLFVSGHPRGAQSDIDNLPEGWSFLGKPFRQAQLAAAVARALDGSVAAAPAA